MLVLSRKPGETIYIGEDIEVMILQVRGDKVRVGIKAPTGMAVDRAEIAAAKRKSALQSES